MTLLFIILGSIAGLFILILLVALFTRKAYSVERSIVIGRAKEPVYDYLRQLEKQDDFSVWVMRDPQMKRTFRGQAGQVGYVYAWDGNKKAGAGEQEIMALTPNERVDLEVRFIRPFAAVAKTPFTLEPAGDGQTKVTWSMSSSMKYPMNFMLVAMNMEQMLGNDMNQSLANLKNILESDPNPKEYRHIET